MDKQDDRKSALDNRAGQLDQQQAKYWRDRGHDATTAERLAREARDAAARPKTGA